MKPEMIKKNYESKKKN